MQTGSRLGPRNRIRGQMYKAVRGTVDYARGFRDHPEIFAKDETCEESRAALKETPMDPIRFNFVIIENFSGMIVLYSLEIYKN